MTSEETTLIIRELEHLKAAMCARELPEAGRLFVDKRIGYYKTLLNGACRFQNNP
jgi:hypothetical protein